MINLSVHPAELAYLKNRVDARRADISHMTPRSLRNMARRALAYLDSDGEILLLSLFTAAGSISEDVDALVQVLASASALGPVEFAGVKFEPAPEPVEQTQG